MTWGFRWQKRLYDKDICFLYWCCPSFSTLCKGCLQYMEITPPCGRSLHSSGYQTINCWFGHVLLLTFISVPAETKNLFSQARSLCSSGPTPSACLCWRWRTWWSWVINLTPSVSLLMFSLWLTTCADTRCPWVGRATSDLLLLVQAFGSCAASLLLSLSLSHLWTSGGSCVCTCARACLLSLSVMVLCHLLHF